MRKLCLVACTVTFAAGASAGCASKTFVRSSVGATNEKVKELVEALEQTQERTGRNERRIAEVDRKTAAAARSAEAARAVADRAFADAKSVDARIAAIDAATRRLVLDVTIASEEGAFGVGDHELPAAARIRIDGVIHELMDDPDNLFIEIEGHTDNRGAPGANRKLGLARAQSVRKYLYDVHQVPLHRMNVISFGMERPAASNRSVEGRAQNRRVVIRIRS